MMMMMVLPEQSGLREVLGLFLPLPRYPGQYLLFTIYH